MDCCIAADAPTVFDGLVFEFGDDRFDYPKWCFSTIGLLDEQMGVVIWTGADKGVASSR